MHGKKHVDGLVLGHRWCFSGWFYQGGTVVFRDVPVFHAVVQPRQDQFSRRKKAFLKTYFALKDCFHGGLSRRWPYENVRSHPYPISCDQLGQECSHKTKLP